MIALNSKPADNLEDLRGQLTQRLALLVMASSSLLIWLTFIQWPFPFTLFGLAAGLVGLSLMVRTLADFYRILARHLLVWGLTAGLLAAMWFFVNPWLPFLAGLVVFIGAMLVPVSSPLAAGLVALLAVWLANNGFRAYPLTELLVMLVLSVVLAWLVVHTFYTALQWATTMQQRADHLLEQMRDRQAELRRTLKSLELASDLQRRTHRELVLARKQAEEARRMKEQFAANISHELRTPLNLILGFSELMHLSPDVYGELNWPPLLRRDVYQIYRSSRHLLEMIDDILDLSRYEMNGFTLNKESTLVESLLQDTIDIAQDLFRTHPARLEVEIEPGLPRLEIDRTRIRQVLLNLLNNARRFTTAGTVRLQARQVKGEVLISVSDSGPGIPADKLPFIFDEFYQVDYSLRRNNGGAGLGLAISKRFVQAHEGRIWVASQEGAGTIFTFSLPVPGHLPVGAQLHAEHLPEPMWPESRPCVLALSTDPSVISMLRRHLEDYEVVWAQEANQLAELVILHHPRAVICNLPPEQPYHRDAMAGIPVPLIDCSLPGQAWLAYDLAVAGCLVKPISSQELLQEIEPLDGIQDILIVDDDRGFVQLVERILQTTGQAFKIRRAYDGRDGLLAMRELRPDLVLLDLMMPDLDGFQVLEQMRAEPELAGVPVVLLTATSYDKDSSVQQENRLVIHHPGGLHPAETLRCLRAVIGVLEPLYDERSTPDQP